MRSELIPQQTHIETTHQAWLVHFAHDHDILVQDLWIRAINNLLARRLTWAKRDGIPYYRAKSTLNLVPWSVRLPMKIVDRVNAAVEYDHTSVRTFYYTALVDFVVAHMETKT